jgi:hypothetical protein
METSCANCESCKFTEPLKDIYYEIHVTVDYDPGFVDYCKSKDIKTVHIDMGEGIPAHLMISHTVKQYEGFNVEDYAYGMALDFIDQAFKVQRVKVETVPWHPEAATGKNYFESHLAVPYYGDKYNKLYHELGLHKSRNLMKKGEQVVQMLTYRQRTQFLTFKKTIESIKQRLEQEGIPVKKTIIEYALFDSNEELDKQWLKI